MALLKHWDFEDNTTKNSWIGLDLDSGGTQNGGISRTLVAWNTATGLSNNAGTFTWDVTPREGSKCGFMVCDPNNVMGNGAHPTSPQGGFRTEYNLGNTSDNGTAASKPERWYAHSIFLHPDWWMGPTGGGLTTHLNQLHLPSGGQGSPALGLTVGGFVSGNPTTLRLYRETCAGSEIFPRLWEDDITQFYGQWIDIVKHVKWSKDADGFVNFYINKTLVSSTTGIATLPCSSPSNVGYQKIGMYHQGGIVYFDSIRFGDANSSLDEVSPPSTSTPATATIAGTGATNMTEGDVVSGGKTITITLANDTWISA